MVFDIAAIAFVLIFALIMMKKGGMSAVLSLGGFVLSIVVASMLYPALTEAVYKTPLPENLEEIVSEVLVIETSADEKSDAQAVDAMPDFLKNLLEDTKNTAVESITTSLAKTVTRLIITVIVFVLLIVVTKLVITLLSGALNLVTKLPVIHELNALVGFGCGFAGGLVVVWIVSMLTLLLATSNSTVAQWVGSSYVLNIMSSINPF